MLKVYTDKIHFSSNVYILTINNNTIIIDPGYYDNEIKNELKNINPKAILLTHGHFDHIKAIDEIKNDYPSIEIYIHKDDYKFLTNPKYNLSEEDNPIIIKAPVNVMEEGEYIINNIKINLINTKGHTKGSSLFYLEDENILFTGDTLFAGSIGKTDFIDGSITDMQGSINKIKSLNLKLNTLICPGHGPMSTYENELKNNIYLMQ